ncbi:translation initiation factor IF-2-like [Pteropus medius]|uniref:translation initiation factor IF-2-like n=1 Tax=Pteropus vampyrus TaxID=132908 RepID=UPI00196A58C3|nr:translation initiation factor IF-2-like [Pteropus giganteus]
MFKFLISLFHHFERSSFPENEFQVNYFQELAPTSPKLLRPSRRRLPGTCGSARAPSPPRTPRGRLGSPWDPPGSGRPPSRGPRSLTSDGLRRQLSLSSPSTTPHPRDLRRLRGCPGLRPPREPRGERELSDPARLRRRGRGQVWARGGGGGGGPGAPPELRPRRAAPRRPGMAPGEPGLGGGGRCAERTVPGGGGPGSPLHLAVCYGTCRTRLCPISLSCLEAFSLERLFFKALGDPPFKTSFKRTHFILDFKSQEF